MNRKSPTCIKFIQLCRKTATLLFRTRYMVQLWPLDLCHLNFKLFSFFTHPPTNVSNRPWAIACDFSTVTTLICQYLEIDPENCTYDQSDRFSWAPEINKNATSAKISKDLGGCTGSMKDREITIHFTHRDKIQNSQAVSSFIV